MFGGRLGYGTKTGFVSFPYADFLAWAKEQGHRYERLYKPAPQRRVQSVQRKRSICAKLHLKANCRCTMVCVDSLAPDRETISPTPLEVEFWLASERERKNAKQKKGLRSCPKCPAKRLKFSCPFAQSISWETSSEESDAFSEKMPSIWKNWNDCKVITDGYFKLDLEALDDWLDAGHTADELILLRNDKP